MLTEIILKGRVQGVCCRMYCRQVALALKMHGAATNLYNGTVQVIISTNNNSKVEEYINALRTNRFNFSFFGTILSAEHRPYYGSLSGDYEW